MQIVKTSDDKIWYIDASAAEHRGKKPCFWQGFPRDKKFFLYIFKT